MRTVGADQGDKLHVSRRGGRHVGVREMVGRTGVGKGIHSSQRTNNREISVSQAQGSAYTLYGAKG